MVQVSDVLEAQETEYGPADVIVADVHVIDPAGRIAASYPETWLFGRVLFGQLKKKKGRTVLGVLEQGAKQPGKNPPWRLGDASDAQEALALRAMATKPDAAEPEPQRQPEPATVGRAPWE